MKYKILKVPFIVLSIVCCICFFSVSASAQENTNTENFLNSGGLSFNVWSLYRNAMDYSLHDSNGQFILTDKVFTNNNVVVKDINGVTTIANENSLLYTQIDANTIRAFSLSVPTTRLEPVFYVNNNYVGQTVMFNCSFTVSFEGVDTATFNTIKTKPMRPYFNIYFGTDKYSYENHYCDVVSSRLDSFSDKTVTYSFILSTSFEREGYILGFWNKFYWNEYGLTFNDDNAVTFSWLNWTLSPIVFYYGTGDLGVFTDEGQLFDFANTSYSQANLPSVSQQIADPPFRSALLFASHTLQDIYDNNTFVKKLIDLSLSIGIICVVLGIGTQIISSVGKDK